MSIEIKNIIEKVLKMLCWYVFKESYQKARRQRIERINKDYVDKIKEEMFKDE